MGKAIPRRCSQLYLKRQPINVNYPEVMQMEAQTLTFSLERETKNTIRYSEQTDGAPPAVGTIYVQKWAMGENPPKTLTVTVAEGQE